MSLAQFYWPQHVRAYRQRAGWLEMQRDPISGGRRWFAFGPDGTYMGAFTSRDRAAYALSQNTLALLYRAPQFDEFDEPEWSPW